MRVHLIDGTYELFRAHFSKRPPHTTPQGKDAKATVGVVSSLLGLLADPHENVTHLAVAFDNPIRSFRNALFDGYKTEEGVPEELLAQFDWVEEGVAALGITVWSMDTFEADDALATGAAMFAKHKSVEQVRILTPDKDLSQCLVGTKVVQLDRRQEKLIDAQSFEADKGFAPESVPDFLALVGDTADGIPGLDGWGEKSAATVLRDYQHLEDIPRDVTKWKTQPRGAQKLSAVLNASLTEAKLYRTLATVRTDVPLKTTLEQLRYAGTEKKQFLEWCQRIGSRSLPQRPTRWV
ncbi:MAG: flap endonuclease [Myxococcaceae bacterium]|nr:flap endonuclease [Myxococcaceae bacterium]